MKKENTTKKGYSTLIVLLLIGFIIVLTTGIFRLVIKEMKSNKVLGDYIKAYAGAESAQELALLDIKKKGYGYDTGVSPTKKDGKYDPKSISLSMYPLDSYLYNPTRDVLISYYNDGKTSNYEGEVYKLGYDIIPLFYITDSPNGVDTIENKVSRITLNITEGVSSDLSWNIIGKEAGMSGIGAFSVNSTGSIKSLINNQFKYNSEMNIEYFLNTSDTNYLVLFNAGNDTIKYTLNGDGSYFTKPRLDITSSGEVGEFRQNIKTRVDNTQFLSILKYSIYSGDIR